MNRKYDKVVELYNSGYSIIDISRETGKCRKAISDYLEKTGLREKQLPTEPRTIEEKTCICQNCGKIYINERGRTCGNVYCSRECSDEHKHKKAVLALEAKKEESIAVCKVCGKQYYKKSRNSVACSKECSMEYNRQQSYDNWTRYKESNLTIMNSVCQECGKTFSYKVMNRVKELKYCSEKCRKKSGKRNSKHKRRCIMKELPKENISIVAIMKKYRNTCQVCGCKVHRSNGKDWSPNIATIDHIVPIAKGGTHTYDNVQLLCAMCNTRKSDNMKGVQLRLFSEAIS
ncbi:MAG: HNH endonuclease [Spirochaetia bacterium]|nr:HNH endonuclease [Spirochaetia bacterium]